MVDNFVKCLKLILVYRIFYKNHTPQETKVLELMWTQ